MKKAKLLIFMLIVLVVAGLSLLEIPNWANIAIKNNLIQSLAANHKLVGLIPSIAQSPAQILPQIQAGPAQLGQPAQIETGSQKQLSSGPSVDPQTVATDAATDLEALLPINGEMVVQRDLDESAVSDREQKDPELRLPQKLGEHRLKKRDVNLIAVSPGRANQGKKHVMSEDADGNMEEIVRETGSRVYAYLAGENSGNVKLDLFFDRSPSAIIEFVRMASRCAGREQGCAKDAMKLESDSQAEVRAVNRTGPAARGIASVSAANHYFGYVCAYRSADMKSVTYTLALNVLEDVPDECHIIGAIVDKGNLAQRLEDEMNVDIKFSMSHVHFEIDEQAGSFRATERYRKVASLLR